MKRDEATEAEMLYILVPWVLSVPIFAVIAFRMWLKRNRAQLALLSSLLGLAALVLVLTSWLLFGLLAWCCQIGGFGTHCITLRASNTFFLATLFAAISCTSLKGESKIFAVLKKSFPAAAAYPTTRGSRFETPTGTDFHSVYCQTKTSGIPLRCRSTNRCKSPRRPGSEIGAA